MAAPQVSVLIASRNRREDLRRCLRALAEQEQDAAGFEVVIGDGGSDDGSVEMAEALETPYRLRVLRLPRPAAGAARRAAIEAAEGPLCICLDATIVPWPTLVSGHLEAHQAESSTVGLGRIVQQPPSRGDWYAEAFAVAWNDRSERLAAEPEPSWTEFHGANFSAPRELLALAAGEVAKDGVVDPEIALRLRHDGGILTYLPQAGGDRAELAPGRELVAESRARGRACAGLASRRGDLAPSLFGRLSGPTPRPAALRRMLLGLRVAPAALRPLGRLLPARGRQLWMRFVSEYSFWRGVHEEAERELWLRISRRTPVLMYHGFAAPGEDGGRYVMTLRSFRAQMRVLRLLRYRPITFAELIAARSGNRPPPARAVVITIDDGYLDNLKVAAPVLARHGFVATLFLVSRRLGAENDWDAEPGLRGRPLMSAEEASEMQRRGHELGAHTRTHCSLPDVDEVEIRDQIDGSRRDLEAVLGIEVESFSYPFGRHDPDAVAAVKAAGFLAACTTRPAHAGLDSDRWRVPRIEVRGSDSLPAFVRKLWIDPA